MGMWAAINDPGGLGFWAAGGGTSCGGSITWRSTDNTTTVEMNP